MNHITTEEGVWVTAFIAMVGASVAAIVKLIQSNGCRMKCHHCNGQQCCDIDCDEGRQPITVSSKSSNSQDNVQV